MRWILAALAALALVAGVLWWQAPRLARLLPSGRIELARREVPGAAFQFPVGKVREQKLDYEEGRLGIEVGKDSIVQIQWDTGEMLSREEFETVMIKPLRDSSGMSVVEHTEVRVGGGAGHRWLLGDKTVEMTFSVWSCGKRFFTLTHASGKNPAALERRILDSFECKPDPARDGQERMIGVEVDVGRDFGVTEENPLTVMSLDSEGLVVALVTSKESPEDPKFDDLVPRVLNGVVTTSGLSGASFQVTTLRRNGQTRKVWRGAGELDGMRRRLLATSLRCGTEMYMTLYNGPDAKPEAGAIDLLFRPRCSKSPKRPPPFAEVARKACARGDKRGCE